MYKGLRFLALLGMTGCVGWKDKGQIGKTGDGFRQSGQGTVSVGRIWRITLSGIRPTSGRTCNRIEAASKNGCQLSDIRRVIMNDRLCTWLGRIGYVHPLHPPFTHGPIGAVIVAFCFGLGMIFWRRNNFLQSAYQVAVIGFVLFFPTVLIGIIDWQYYYSGAWMFPIKMKIALATLLFILLCVILIVGRTPYARPSIMMLLYMFCLFDVMGLGYFGGQLVH
jgi:uncharacterized membrane protein